MNILVYSIFSPPELTGIGKYNGEMIKWLSNKGHRIDLVTTFPFYPDWKVKVSYRKKWFKTERISRNIVAHRSKAYIPEKVNGFTRVIHEMSFIITSFGNLIKNMISNNYDIMICVAPPFHLAIPLLILSKIFGRPPVIFHIQDLQIDAAKELKILPLFLLNVLEKIEILVLKSSDLVSTISEGMVRKIRNKKNYKREIYFFPNWTDTEFIKPKSSEKWLHKYLGLQIEKKLIVYSGNIGAKQGLEILIKVAKDFNSMPEIHFVILGNGAYKNNLIHLFEKEKLSNVTFSDLVPIDRLNDMLNDSFIQLVIQKGEGSDSYLPSKLTNIFASGTASIVTAEKGTGLHEIINQNKCASIATPDSANSISSKLEILLSNNKLRNKISNNARQYAENYLNKDNVMSSFEKKLYNLINEFK